MANKPNNPSLWSKAKSLAKQKFDVYPSAYANGWAAKWYKSKGGTWRKAQDGMVVPLDDLDAEQIGGLFPRIMKDGGDPDGAMALGQIDATIEKLQRLRQFIQPDSDLEPWVNSKLTLMDDYSSSVSDYMNYNPEAQEEGKEEEEAPMTENEMEEMKNGGIPQRYRNQGFTKVGVKRKSTRPGKKWMVLAKKGDKYKIVHGGYKGMQDYTQHHSKQRQKNFWNRMGGKNSGKATDPFSPLYWHKRFGTWEEGGETPVYQHGGHYNLDGEWVKSKGSGTNSGIAYYQTGGNTMTQQSNNQQDEIMKIVELYSEIAQVDPKEVVKELQQLQPADQQKAVQQMVQAIKSVQSSGSQQSMMAAQQPTMKGGGNMPCYSCGGSYAYGGSYEYGGMADEMGGVVLPSMPVDFYGLPSYAEGGKWIQKAVKHPGRCTPGSPNYDCPKGSPQWNLAQRFKHGDLSKHQMGGYTDNPYIEGIIEMQDGGKPEWLIRAQLKAQGYSGPALENKLEQMKQGGIHINPKNKGKFTAKAKAAGMGVQAFANKVLGAPEGQYSGSTRKQANFAHVFGGRNYQVGGEYNMSAQEIQDLINQGYNIEYLD